MPNTASACLLSVPSPIQAHFWQEDKGAFIGDTIGETPVLEVNGKDVWHSADGLHGQVGGGHWWVLGGGRWKGAIGEVVRVDCG